MFTPSPRGGESFSTDLTHHQAAEGFPENRRENYGNGYYRGIGLRTDADGGGQVEVKKTKKSAGMVSVQDFQEKTDVFAALHPERRIVPAFFSTGDSPQRPLHSVRERVSVRRRKFGG
jgi:hypothetical protein